MNHALEMISALERQMNPDAAGYMNWHSGTIAGADYHLAWKHGERRLGDTCFEDVLTIEAIELAEEIRGTGVLTEFITTILQGDPAPRIPLRYLHFKDCGPGLSSLLKRLHFHRYLIGNSMDWWHPVTGQKELSL